VCVSIYGSFTTHAARIFVIAEVLTILLLNSIPFYDILSDVGNLRV